VTDEQLNYLVGGVITRASEGADGGLLVSVSTDHGHYVIEAKACQCGKPCDLTHIHITKITGHSGE
jgi:hypothetical protein